MDWLEELFYKIGGIGALIIMFFTMYLIDNPFELIKGINFDYPIFLVYSIPFILGLFAILYVIFKIINKHESK